MRIPELQMCVYVGPHGYDIDFAGAKKFISAAHTRDKDSESVGKFIAAYLLKGYTNYYLDSYDGSYAQNEVNCDEAIFDCEIKKAIRRKKARIKKLDTRHDNEKRIMLVSETINGFIAEYELKDKDEMVRFDINLDIDKLSITFQTIIESMNL